MPLHTIKSPRTKGSSCDAKKFIERRPTPQQLDLDWDYWHSVPEGATSPPYPSPGFSSPINTSPSSVEPRSTKSKKWEFFGTKKQPLHSAPPIIPDTHRFPLTPTTPDLNESRRSLTKKQSKLMKKKSGSLKIRIKSTPYSRSAVLGPIDVDNVCGPGPELPRLSRRFPSVSVHEPGQMEDPLHVPEGPMTADVPADSEAVASAVYFTIDPDWDDLKGEGADVYLLAGDLWAGEVGSRFAEVFNAQHVDSEVPENVDGHEHDAPCGEVRMNKEISFLLFD